MRFSVIIPAHNSEKFIWNALSSIERQSFRDFELIVVCDRCTDNTKSIAESYGAKTIDVDYGRDGLTRNAGLDIAQGEYVIWSDDDDWFLHEFVFEEIDKKLKQENNPDLLCCSFIWGKIMYARPIAKNKSLYPSVWNKIWKKSYISSHRFNGVYSISDSYFHEEMMRVPHTQVIWDFPIIYYNYLREGSISHEMKRTVTGTKAAWRID